MSGSQFASKLTVYTPGQTQPSTSFELAGTYTPYTAPSSGQFATSLQLFTPAETQPSTSFILAGYYVPVPTPPAPPHVGQFASALSLFTPAEVQPSTSFILAGTYAPYSLPPTAGPYTNTPNVPTTLQQTIPSYLYQQYSDDDDLQAFVASFNAMAQQYVDWFNGINLPIYTSPTIAGALLDWVGQGLYGIIRPALSSSSSTYVGPFNTYPLDSIDFDARDTATESVYYTITDDIYKRILTWNLYRGDGDNFNIRWLKRRIVRFLGGTNGTDVIPDETYQVSVAISGAAVTITLHKTNAIWPITDYQVLQAALLAQVLQLPFQYTYTITITA